MKRIEWIDVAKAIGIILVVFAHALTKNTYMWNIIQQFHMPLFFIISGILFKGNVLSKKLVISKLKRLYIPFVVLNIISTIILSSKNFSIIKKIIKVILLMKTSGIFGATWFLGSLFIISLLIPTIYKVIKIQNKSKKQVIIFNSILILIFLLLGLFTPVKSHHLSATLMGTSYYLFGYNLKNLNVFNKMLSLNKIKKIFLICICTLLLLGIASINVVSFSKGIYTFPVLSIISAISGCTITYILSNMLCHNKLLNYVGKYTLEIMIWQFLAFKLVIVVQILVYNLNFSVISYFPYYDNHGIWLYLLAIFGIIVPIIMANIYKKIIETGKKLKV